MRTFPYQTVVASLYDAGDYEASLSKAMEIHDVKGFKQHARELKARQAADISYSTYIEAAGPRRRRGGILGARRWPVESAEVQGQSHRVRSRS